MFPEARTERGQGWSGQSPMPPGRISLDQSPDCRVRTGGTGKIMFDRPRSRQSWLDNKVDNLLSRSAPSQPFTPKDFQPQGEYAHSDVASRDRFCHAGQDRLDFFPGYESLTVLEEFSRRARSRVDRGNRSPKDHRTGVQGSA